MAEALFLVTLLVAHAWDEEVHTNQPPAQLAFTLSMKVINGSEPEDGAAFDALQAKGVKTIISVDGAQPDVEAARTRGIRYVHLPIGYNGIPPERGLKLVRAIRDLPGPIYIHCHHGKHRSPAAAAYVSVALGEATPEEAIAYMEQSGTSKQYDGLYKCVANAKRIDSGQIDAIPLDFPGRTTPTEMVELMVAIDRSFDRLKQLRENEWQPLPNHPDVTAAQESKILRELLTRVKPVGAQHAAHPQFDRLVLEGVGAGESLAKLLRAGAGDFAAAMERVNQSCRACHKALRDAPNFAPESN